MQSLSLRLTSNKEGSIFFFFKTALLNVVFCFRRKGYRTDATVSVLLGFLLFLIPARRPFSRAPRTTAGGGSTEKDPDPLAPMITWKDFQNLMPWEIVILVGGGYALAAGCKVPG